MTDVLIWALAYLACGVITVRVLAAADKRRGDTVPPEWQAVLLVLLFWPMFVIGGGVPWLLRWLGR